MVKSRCEKSVFGLAAMATVFLTWQQGANSAILTFKRAKI